MIPAEKTAVILVNWCGARDSVECIGSLLNLEQAPGPIIVVDNASPDDSVEHIRNWLQGLSSQAPEKVTTGVHVAVRMPADVSWCELRDGDELPLPLPRIVLVRSRVNGGFAGGNNIGLRMALKADIDAFWLLNTDTVVPSNCLDELLKRASAVPGAGMIGSTLRYYWQPDLVQGLGGARFNEKTGAGEHLGIDESVDKIPVDPTAVERSLDYIVGASMLVTRPFVTDVGLMCEDYFLYFEEIDWALRARGRYELAYAPASHVFHKVGGSSMKKESRRSLRYLYQNRLRLIGRFFPEARFSAVRHMLLQILQHGRRRHWADVAELMIAVRNARRLFGLQSVK